MTRVAAGDSEFEGRIQDMAQSVQARFRYHSIDLPDGSILPGLQSVEHMRNRLSVFGVPQDLRGKRVLDIGAWDGWFSFECERRGAEVVAVDCVELDTFLEARELLRSKVEYRTLDVVELSSDKLGHFDIVLFFGVLYHLRHPLLGLEKALELSTDQVLVESFVITSEPRTIPAVMEFYERGELGGQIDNWCGPSPECLLAMCRSAGFAQAEILEIASQRASAICRRHWPAPAAPTAAAPHLNSVANNRTHVAMFHPDKEEYLCCYFKSAEFGLAVDSVFVEVDGFGVPALVVAATEGNGYQVNCLRPPGLAPGRHVVRVRTANSANSNAVEFEMLDRDGRGVAVPSSNLPQDPPELCSAEFHPSGDRRLTAARAGSLVCYFRSSADRLGCADVEIEIGTRKLRPHTVGSLGDCVWQANVLLSSAIPPGETARLRLGLGNWTPNQTIGHERIRQ